ncbi:pentatricopeptide repeat-containing protein At2g20710, mitochondrial-like [Euphorbia lathyris]|uniref:pentatricopeptide repeat-containing protein At2g20710, mitochondrial-like n=1 Tax=Euphorbia lathyris TaxID=212925 RepID=UPI0033131B13
MNLLQRWSSNLRHRVEGLLKFQSVQTSTPQIGPLYDRIIATTRRDSSPSIVPVLDQWLEERKSLSVRKVRKCISELRRDGHYNHALQVSDWVTGQRGFHLSRTDIKIRMHLISKLHGLGKAEEYFNSIAKSYPGIKTDNALLHFYAKTKEMEKAEALFQNMKDLGFVNIAFSYRTMQHLYRRMGKHEKADLLRKEMDEKDIDCNIFTFNKRLQDCSDIECMEKLLENMNPQIKMNFHSCIIAAKGYLKAGRFDKTMTMLKRSESLIYHKSRMTCYETLLGLYAAIGDKASVYRVWDSYKQTGMLLSQGYFHMILSLLNVDDLVGAEKIYEEWESGKNEFEIGIPNLMIGAFSRRGLMEKAEAYINKILEKGKKPNSTSWGHLTIGYLQQRSQMKKAVDSIKKALSTPKQVWMPRFGTSEKCLRYLKGQGDKEQAEELLKMINKQCHLSTDEYNRLSSFVKA